MDNPLENYKQKGGYVKKAAASKNVTYETIKLSNTSGSEIRETTIKAHVADCKHRFDCICCLQRTSIITVTNILSREAV